MKVLADTHAFLWFVLNDPHLSAGARAVIAEPTNEVLFSPASYWEIAIKVSTGKYTLQQDYFTFMSRQLQQNSFRILPIELQHTALVATLPYHHRDPFDRLLIAQSLVEQIPIVTGDAIFDRYGVRREW
jgi:PIN domain nuclease of toxin-antitoxin system